jgi:hypothetical protein
MKIAIFFLAGMVVSLLIVFAISHAGTPAKSDDSSPATPTPYSTTTDVTSMLPDIKGIYHTCLTEPFKQVETEIHDPDIANFYHKLMQDTGLTGNNTQPQ